MKRATIVVIIVCAVTAAAAAGPVTVGIEGRREVMLPEVGLKARAPERSSPMTVRIARAAAQNDGTHYDLRYIGLVPGKYDLRTYLRRADGSAATDLPALEVEVQALLPAGEGGMLIAVPDGTVSKFGGYRWMIAGVVVLWLLAAIPTFRRRRLARPETPAHPPAPLSLPERLRPLVERAAAGTLDVTGKAELERMVVSHWCGELGLGEVDRAKALVHLREHPQAGVLLRALEEWLHRRPGTKPIDLEPLLAAYGPARAQEAPAA